MDSARNEAIKSEPVVGVVALSEEICRRQGYRVDNQMGQKFHRGYVGVCKSPIRPQHRAGWAKLSIFPYLVDEDVFSP